MVIAFDWPWWISGLIGLAILVIASAIYYLRLRARRSKTAKPAEATDLDLVMPTSVRMVNIDPAQPPVLPGPTTPVKPADTVATP